MPSKIATADGGAILTQAMAHPDPLCEALRRQVTEAGLVQAAGRIRAINRTAGSPADIHLWADIFVPDLGPVEALLWQGPTIDEEMLAKGAWFERTRDAVAVHDDLGSHQYVDRERGESMATFAYKGHYKQRLPGSPLPARYRLAKAGSGETRALFLLPDAAAAQALLTKKLGPLDVFEVLTASPAGTTVFCCREGTTDTPLTLRNGRPLSIAPWEFEDCLAPHRKQRAENSFIFRREGANMSIYMAA